MLRLLIFPITAPFPDKLLSTPMFRRLSAQVDHLTKKPQNGERCLKEIQSILVENDISPFEVYVLLPIMIYQPIRFTRALFINPWDKSVFT